MSYETLKVETRDYITTITINRPSKLNALNRTVLSELAAALRSAGMDSGTRAAILTGSGDRAFVAGADIEEMSSMNVVEAKMFSEAGHTVCHLLESLPMPVIAAVNGFALGGGCELALACDFIYASEKARFGQPEVNLGLMPGFGGTQRLAKRIGPGRAREMIYTGEPIGAQRALEIGLVNRVLATSELMEAAIATASKIALKGPVAVAASKRTVLRGTDSSLASGTELEACAFAGLFCTEDMKEGTRAFLEKRTPTFLGR